jgi:hypothetical protein
MVRPGSTTARRSDGLTLYHFGAGKQASGRSLCTGGRASATQARGTTSGRKAGGQAGLRRTRAAALLMSNQRGPRHLA